jgi:hypothetical protein
MNALPAQSTMNRSQPIGKTRFGDRNNTSLQSIFSQNESRRYREQQRAPQVIFVLPPPAQNEVIEKRHSLAGDLTEDEIVALDRVYLIRRREAVCAFLAKNRFLLPLLNQAPHEIRKHFGENAKLGLRMSFDLENPDKLFIQILPSLPVDDAFSLFEAVNADWWLDAMDEADWKLNLIVEYE